MLVEIEKPLRILGIRIPFLWKCYDMEIDDDPWPPYQNYRIRFHL